MFQGLNLFSDKSSWVNPKRYCQRIVDITYATDRNIANRLISLTYTDNVPGMDLVM